MVLRILNLDRHQNFEISSKDTTMLTMFCTQDLLVFFGSSTNLLWIMGESAGEGLWLLALVTGGSWYVTCDNYFLFISYFYKKKCQKSLKKVPKIICKKCLKVPKHARKRKKRKCQKAGFHIIGATIRTRREVGVFRMRDFFTINYFLANFLTITEALRFRSQIQKSP